MKHIDPTLLMSMLTSLVAIIVPTISTIINSIIEYKIAKLNNTLEIQLNLLSEFSNAYSQCQYGEHGKGYALYFYKTTLKLVPLCHHRCVRKALLDLTSNVLSQGATKDNDKKYEKCIRLLSKEF